jgi:DNA-3-methyladenine glycosylase
VLRVLPRHFYERETSLVARALLGTFVARQLGQGEVLARIVETEAYLGPHDLACHSSKGRTPRTEVMFGPAGVAYVYLVYGMHYCLNVVTGQGAAVLVRAVELPGQSGRSGPGRLTRALQITLAHNRLPLDAAPLRLLEDSAAPAVGRIATGPRIGVDYAGPTWARRKLRFWLPDSPAVSRP